MIGLTLKLHISLCDFFSLGDERRFFEALHAIRGVQKIVGNDRGLTMTLNVRRLTRESLEDLISLLWRYRIALHPVLQLASVARFAWINDSYWYWHEDMLNDRAIGS